MTREEVELCAEMLDGSSEDRTDVEFPKIETDENIIAFYNRVLHCLTYITDCDISFGDKIYKNFDFEYYEKTYINEKGINVIDKTSFISNEEIKKRLELFMRRYKLKKIMRKI